MPSAIKLSPENLTVKFTLNDFQPEPSVLQHSSSLLGQDRAENAMAFAMAMTAPGYNVFVMGEPGSGRLSMVNNVLNSLSKQQETPPCFAYVQNFRNAREALALEFSCECAIAFNQDLLELIDNVSTVFPGVFESPTYQQQKITIEREFNNRYNTALDTVEQKAMERKIAMFRDNETITFAPMRNGNTLDEEQFSNLTQKEHDLFNKQVTELESILADALLELPLWRRQRMEQLKKLHRDTIHSALEPLFHPLNNKYLNNDDIQYYLNEIRQDLANHRIANLFNNDNNEINPDRKSIQHYLQEQYLCNIVTELYDQSGAPVVYEPHPIHQNLFGRIEYQQDQGSINTNYRLICAGAIHRANGGYLILDADKLLSYPNVWDTLKRALKTSCIAIEPQIQDANINAVTLKVAPIPLNIKIVLLGNSEIFYLLQELDREFSEIFRVLADFNHYINITEQSTRQFAQLICRHAHDSNFLPLSNDAITELLTYSCRLAENQQRFSARIRDVLDIIAEANYLSRSKKHTCIDKHHINQAILARQQRSGRFNRLLLDEILDGTILINTSGQCIGIINGLTVLEIGDSTFGAPSRITATVHPGSRGIVDIEREADLGLSIHSKGVMILTGYLGQRYARDMHLAISANIAIEQSYGEIEGDSAALAELCALISALTQIPVQQNLAITGSINQYGEVQAVGGVNEKIEGFFNLCLARKLDANQGVIIPNANRNNLVLSAAVINAVNDKLFNIYTVSHVDQALELLTGKQLGELNDQGEYPEGSLNYHIVNNLKAMSENDSDKQEEQDNNKEPVDDPKT